MYKIISLYNKNRIKINKFFFIIFLKKNIIKILKNIIVKENIIHFFQNMRYILS